MPARVYDYYAPERYEEIMVNAYSIYQLSICHVCGSYQCPYCPIYSKANFISLNGLVIFINLFIIILLKKLTLDDPFFKKI